MYCMYLGAVIVVEVIVIVVWIKVEIVVIVLENKEIFLIPVSQLLLYII